MWLLFFTHIHLLLEAWSLGWQYLDLLWTFIGLQGVPSEDTEVLVFAARLAFVNEWTLHKGQAWPLQCV